MSSRSPRLGPLVRRLGETAWGGPGLRRAYVTLARTAAALLGRVEGVSAVLATGSVTRPEFLSPGSSDIDLLLVTDLPTPDAELALIRRLRAVHGALHATFPVFTNLDYVEARDLDLLRAFGNAWSIDFDERFALLSGEAPRVPDRPLERPAFERRLEQAVLAMKRWMRASGFLLDPRADAARKPRTLQRLLMDLLSARTGLNRFTPLDALVEETTRGGALPLLARWNGERTPSLDLGVAAALEATDALVGSVSLHWNDAFLVDQAPRLLEPSAEARAQAAISQAEGLSPMLLPRGPDGGGAHSVAVAPRSDDPLDTVRRAARMFERVPAQAPVELRWLAAPVVVTSTGLRAAALWSPAPMVAPAMASAWTPDASRRQGPPSPPEAELSSLLRAQTLEQFVRRLARTQRSRGALDAELAFEETALRPALAHAQDTGRFRLRAACPAAVSEAESVERRRDWLDRRRTALGPELRRRQVGAQGGSGIR